MGGTAALLKPRSHLRVVRPGRDFGGWPGPGRSVIETDAVSSPFSSILFEKFCPTGLTSRFNSEGTWKVGTAAERPIRVTAGKENSSPTVLKSRLEQHAVERLSPRVRCCPTQRAGTPERNVHTLNSCSVLPR